MDSSDPQKNRQHSPLKTNQADPDAHVSSARKANNSSARRRIQAASSKSKKQEALSKQFTPYKQLETGAALKSIMPQLKQSRSPAKIRINASIRNQPYRNSGSDLNGGEGGTGSEKNSKTSNSVDPSQMNDMERLEPYLKPTTPIRPMKNFVSTVSYLRPATENKAIGVHSQTQAMNTVQQRANQKQPGGSKPQRLQSAGTMHGNYAANRIAKKRGLTAGGRGNNNSGLPSVHLNSTLANVKSGQTRATNISSNERSSPVMNNITDKGLSVVFPEDQRRAAGAGAEQSQITFQSLQEGDIFDKDIQRIMSIINGVEKQFGERKITKDFQSALHDAYKRRVLQVDHEQLVNQTMQLSNNSQIQSKKRGQKFVMPNTYASVVTTGNLNQESGDLNLFSSAKKQIQSFNNLPLSPKSHHATLLNNARRQKMKSSNPAVLFDQNSNQDLNVNSQVFQSTYTTQKQHQKMVRRRPQTTKRIVSGAKAPHSQLGLKKDSSMLTSVQQDAAFNYNEAALMRTQQHMHESQKRESVNVISGLQSDPDLVANGSVPRNIATADGNTRVRHMFPASDMSSAAGLQHAGSPPIIHDSDAALESHHFAQRRTSSQMEPVNETIGKSSQMTGPQVANPQKVLMQINKYVHPCERLPHFVKQEDMDILALDYTKKENERIKDHLMAFDELVTRTLCGTQDGSMSRLKRYQRDYLPDKGCDNDLEEQLCYVMFIDDLKDIRNLLISFLHDTLSGQLTAEKKFAKEREFFSEQVSNVKKANQDLQKRIDQLEKDLEYEKNYNLQLFVDEQVTQMCQRAYFSFNLISKENQIKAFADVDENRDQNQTSSRANLVSKPQSQSNQAVTLQQQQHQQSQGSILDSVLDGSVHVGYKDKIQESSLTKLDALAKSTGEVTIDGATIPASTLQELDLLRKAVNDLKWKIQYEEGLHKEMVELLEKKVAGYLVQINTFQENEVELKAKQEVQETQIEQNQKKIKQLCDQLSLRTIENEKLQFKIVEISENVVGMTKFEKIQSDLNIATSQIKYKNGKIENQQLEIEQLTLIIKELHSKVQTAVQSTERKSEQLESFVDNTLVKMNKKLNKVHQLFQDTLLYSSKTYYQEEIYRRDKITKALQDRVAQLEKKQKLLQQQKKIQKQLAKKLMTDVDRIESSSESEEDEAAFNLPEDEQKIKKDEIMANLKHLNLLGTQTSSRVNSPTDVLDGGLGKHSEKSKTGDLSSPAGQTPIKLHDQQQQNQGLLKEPSISASEDEIDLEASQQKLKEDDRQRPEMIASLGQALDMAKRNSSNTSSSKARKSLAQKVSGQILFQKGIKPKNHDQSEDSEGSIKYADAANGQLLQSSESDQ